MQTATTKQLNNRFSFVPSEFYGRRCSALFQSGGRRCRSSKVLTAALLSTRETVLGDGCTTSYSDFERELGYSRATIAGDVAELTKDGGPFKRPAQSKYSAAYEFDKKRGVPVYHFLLTETFNGIKLTGNDALYLSIMAQFYLNPEREQKYFVGGENRAAKAIGCAASTAHGMVYRLMKADLITRLVMHEGELSKGKGINGKIVTVYIVNDQVLKRIKEIRKAINKAQAEKEALKALFTVKLEPKPNAPQIRSAGHYNKYAPATSEEENEQKFQKLDAAFSSDKTYQNIKQRYVQLKAVWFDTLTKAMNFDRADEIEHEMNDVADELKDYIQSRGAPPGDIPADIGPYIK